jgi:hypothetical protein
MNAENADSISLPLPNERFAMRIEGFAARIRFDTKFCLEFNRAGAA